MCIYSEMLRCRAKHHLNSESESFPLLIIIIMLFMCDQNHPATSSAGMLQMGVYGKGESGTSGWILRGGGTTGWVQKWGAGLLIDFPLHVSAIALSFFFSEKKNVPCFISLYFIIYYYYYNYYITPIIIIIPTTTAHRKW